MKMGELHIVPLARQAVAILRELQALTGGLGEYVFPSLLTLTRPMSNNTVNTALRRLGYTKDQMMGHGFRNVAWNGLDVPVEVWRNVPDGRKTSTHVESSASNHFQQPLDGHFLNRARDEGNIPVLLRPFIFFRRPEHTPAYAELPFPRRLACVDHPLRPSSGAS